MIEAHSIPKHLQHLHRAQLRWFGPPRIALHHLDGCEGLLGLCAWKLPVEVLATTYPGRPRIVEGVGDLHVRLPSVEALMPL